MDVIENSTNNNLKNKLFAENNNSNNNLLEYNNLEKIFFNKFNYIFCFVSNNIIRLLKNNIIFNSNKFNFNFYDTNNQNLKI